MRNCLRFGAPTLHTNLSHQFVYKHQKSTGFNFSPVRRRLTYVFDGRDFMLTVASERLRGWICGGVWFVFDFSFDLSIYLFFFFVQKRSAGRMVFWLTLNTSEQRCCFSFCVYTRLVQRGEEKILSNQVPSCRSDKWRFGSKLRH